MKMHIPMNKDLEMIREQVKNVRKLQRIKMLGMGWLGGGCSSDLNLPYHFDIV